jgi:oligogalacturonide lyase
MARITRRAFLAASTPMLAKEVRAGKGARFQAPMVKFADPLTERQMWRLTDPTVLHHLPHYHHHFISRNNESLLVTSEISGERQIFELRVEEAGKGSAQTATGRMTQLTEGPGVHPYSATLGTRDRWIYFLQGDTLKQVEIRNGKERKIYTAPAGWRLTGHLSAADQGTYVALIEMRAGDWVSGFEQQFEKRPRCRLRVVESRSGRNWIAVETDNWLANPQFRPAGTAILYSYEGPWHKVDGRLHLVGLNGENPRSLRPREGAEGLGHEFWGADEDQSYFIYYVFYPDETGRGATVRRIAENSDKEEVVSRCTSFGWLQGNDDSSVIVGASRSLAGPNIYLLFTHLKRELTVCEHATSSKPYPIAGADAQDPSVAWPEPVFSHDSQWIYFTSDKEGKPAIYRMNVADLVEQPGAGELSPDL